MKIERPALYVVGTPIGNMDDFSPRGAEILAAVDFIAAEDTRVTRKLLTHCGIKKELVSYYEHNLRERGEEIIRRLQSGACCALCSDAGMPAISDPGEDIVRLAAAAGIPVHSVPGPSAVVTALALSGLPTGRFTFEGFLSTSRKSRMEHLADIRTERRTMVFYEAPHKLLTTLSDLLDALGDRPVAVCRELTKLHEDVLRTTLSDALAHFRQTPPKGEFVLVVGGAEPEQKASSGSVSPEEFSRFLAARAADGCGKKEALALAASHFGLTRNEAYALSLSIKRASADEMQKNFPQSP